MMITTKKIGKDFLLITRVENCHDHPTQENIIISAAALEYTSRLIERKLTHINVAAKVVAAYPGALMTRYKIELPVGLSTRQVANSVKCLARELSMETLFVPSGTTTEDDFVIELSLSNSLQNEISHYINR